MWQRFTERARKVVFYAQEEAQKFGEAFVSTEHLLLGLLRETHNTGCQMLGKLGIHPTEVQTEVEKQLPTKDARPSMDMTLTPRAKRVIDLAYENARNLGDNYIGTEHLLLGLIREGDGLAGRVLVKLGAEMDSAVQVLNDIRVAAGSAPAPPPVPHLDRTFGFLMGASLQEHLMLSLIADGGKVTEIIMAQVADLGMLQYALWKEIVRYATQGAKRRYPEMLNQLLASASEEAKAGEVEPEHLLLALLDPKWQDYRFAIIVAESGLDLERSRELVARGM